MSRSPISAFNELDEALVRGIALISMARSNPDTIADITPRLEEVMAEVFEAYSTLLVGSEAITEIKAFLLVTYGGQPG